MKKVEIYTWKTCPFCMRAKALLETEKIPFEEHQIDGDLAALSELKARTGVGTVPQIFVDGTFIGGSDDLQQRYADGEFASLFGLAD